MKHTDEVATPVDTIRRRVKELRGSRGMTAAELAEELDKAGVPWNRSIVANFEGGRRTTVSVVEWLALSRVLNVAPIHLLVHPDSSPDSEYQVTPSGPAYPVGEVREWVRAYSSMGSRKPSQFFRETPQGERVSFDTTTTEGQRAALDWAKRSGLGTVTETGGDSGEHR